MNTIVIVYFICGILTLLFDWFVNYSKEYKELKEQKMTDDSMACMYMLFVIVFWPLRILILLINKLRK